MAAIIAGGIAAAITSVIPGVGTTNLGKQNQAVWADTGTEVGVLTLAADESSSRLGPLLLNTGNLKVTLRDSGGDQILVDATGDLQGIGLIRTSVTPGTSAAHLGKAEGAAHASGNTGVLALAVENSALSPLTGIVAGDYCPIAVDQTGGVILSPNVTVTTQDSSDYAEDAGHTTGQMGSFVLGVRNDSGATSRTNANSDYSPISTDIRGRLWVSHAFETRSDTYTTTANGTTVTVATFPLKYFSISVAQTGTVTAWDVRLEVSLDNTTFTTVLTHTNVTGSGVSLNYVSPWPTLYFRSRCAAITLGAGTNVIATILGMN